jgi:glycosyltransferase involved in cell wall biosynthesis
VPAVWRSILLTPNVLGKDGVSALSREMARALPAPALVLSLHDRPVPAELSPVGLEVRGARGSRSAFLVSATIAARQAGSDTTIACSHLHLAPIAKILTMLAGRGARLMVVLCGIEAWVPLRLLERWALATSDVAAISRHTVTRFKAANPKLASMDVTVCHPGLPAASAAAPRHGPSSIALIVARMSASERYKGHDTLLDVWPQVLERHPDAVLAIAGDGDDRPRLEAKSRELGLERVVTFIGRIPDNALAGLYARCRFFVMPSRDEGFGLVFLEAMRAAKPCIGGAGAASEIIEDGVTGFVIDPGSREALLAAILRLYGDDGVCAQLGAAGRARFLSEFTDRQFQARFARIIAHDAPSGKTPLAAPVS